MTARVLGGDFRVVGEEARDATMEDIGGKERPPGYPPDAPGSWVSKVVGCNEGGMPVPEEVVDEEFVKSRLRLEFPNGEDGEPEITIGEEVLTAMNNLWKSCMIVRVLGRNIPILSLTRRLEELWKPKGSMHVMDLPRHFFMVRFEKEEEYMAALSGGPWRAFGSYLMVQAWTPEFDPLKDEIDTMPVWVRISHIPVNFYHKTILMGIARGLGRPIRVDMTTLKLERARFARVCVEVNLNKPLKGSVLINGERYFVSYEGISSICSKCGMYGHLVHTCPKNDVEGTMVVVPAQEITNHVSTEARGKETGFTQVRHARKKTDQQRRSEDLMRSNEGRAVAGNIHKEVQSNSVVEKIKVSNRFGSLTESGEMVELQDDTEKEDENKENENTVDPNVGSGSNGLGKVMAFAATRVKGDQTSTRMGLKEKKTNLKSPNFTRPKPKSVGPTRGLTYGPAKGEVNLSLSGKRLRVERESIGRRGGVFTGEGGGDGSEKDPVHGSEGSLIPVQMEVIENLRKDGAELGEEESSKGVEA
ncbi:uncharacterized protein LOC108850579 [Raphanus sativus]|uniref:Uncharacterized protein LOC108850579 n=1 Tax=Raphanus sativus TaxID=3726 RepID=A0A6J0N677_RAPSA|nr:uncharacterized protein LOC108850579 [Raphanus sativus]